MLRVDETEESPLPDCRCYENSTLPTRYVVPSPEGPGAGSASTLPTDDAACFNVDWDPRRWDWIPAFAGMPMWGGRALFHSNDIRREPLNSWSLNCYVLRCGPLAYASISIIRRMDRPRSPHGETASSAIRPRAPRASPPSRPAGPRERGLPRSTPALRCTTPGRARLCLTA